jgi:hypothetical protein
MATDVGPRSSAMLIEEYKIQRTAVSAKLTASQHTATFGGATAGILIAAGFNIWNQTKTLPATLIFLVAVPLVSAAVVVQWVGQMRSYDRTRKHIHALEDAILQDLQRDGDVPKDLFGPHVKTGRKWYRPDERWFGSAGILIFVWLALGSLALGGYKGYADHKALVAVVGPSEFIALATLAVVLLWSLRDKTTGTSQASPLNEAASRVR